jgi:hypothetical protein
VGDASRRSIDDFADKLERRAARARAAAETERVSERHLDDVLGNRGFYCLHDCRWPGSSVANIDHVVVGPTGIWVVDDKRMTGKITINKKGEVWSGRYPFAPTLAKLRAQAEAVQGAIPSCPTVHPLAAIHATPVPDGRQHVDGVWMASAGWDTTSVILGAEQVFSEAALRGLADALMEQLKPTSTTRPQQDVEHLVVPPPRTPAPYAVTFPPQRPNVRTPSFTPPPPASSVSRARSPLGRALTKPRSLRWPRTRGKRLLLVVVGLWVGAAATSAVVDAVRTSATDASSSPTSITPVAAAYECRVPGAGWTEVIRWEPVDGAIVAVEWADAPEGPWTQLPLGDGVAERGGVASGTSSLARVRYSPGPGAEAQVMTATSSPIAPC